eukprot:90987_1
MQNYGKYKWTINYGISSKNNWSLSEDSTHFTVFEIGKLQWMMQLKVSQKKSKICILMPSLLTFPASWKTVVVAVTTEFIESNSKNTSILAYNKTCLQNTEMHTSNIIYHCFFH